ncbi:bifunctional epoxide hydrolase 2 isoform X2 [Selaginella moellendorffii]|uniref:bifunctional epoxide hydrolase 2 isoform X2 n=1 Tax=Selaginella moellendorffii TaxID=88036 RepID=UPI000D1C4C90|nr:bifunctional epoxide hydrolase 2 isoform X2 [Selaginella moellendorffii]|eukprot:XP_024521084.1 bifunctional epoxide hydrolase 2 isoform X2 [Selaginella moellendorffii]
MIRKGYVSVSDGQIHYRRADPEGNSLGSFLLLHQHPSSSKMWEPVMPLLASRGYQAVAIDIPGYGESFHCEVSLETIARYVFEAIPLLTLSEPSIVVGHHIGAAVAMQLAVDFPESVKKLALWGVPILDESVKKFVPEAPDFEDEDLKAVIKFWKIRNKVPGKPGYKMPPHARASRLLEMLQSNPRARELPLLLKVESLVDRITQPTLCMCGDHELLKDATIKTSKEFRNGELCFIQDGGMDVQIELPEEFASALVGFA